MATDTELADQQREAKLVMRRYRQYRWFTYGLYFCLFGVTAILLNSLLPDGDLSRSVAIGLLIGACLFLAEWISALVFKRKSRPWRSRHEEDRNPRTR